MPVVPVAIHGSQGIRSWRRLVFPKVTIHYGEPITLPRRRGPDARAAAGGAVEIFGHVRELYDELDATAEPVIKRVRDGRAARTRPSYS